MCVTHQIHQETHSHSERGKKGPWYPLRRLLRVLCPHARTIIRLHTHVATPPSAPVENMGGGGGRKDTVLGAWEEEEADIMGRKHLPQLDRDGATNSSRARILPHVRWAPAAEASKHHNSADAAAPLCLHLAAPPTPVTCGNVSWSTWLQVMQ